MEDIGKWGVGKESRGKIEKRLRGGKKNMRREGEVVWEGGRDEGGRRGEKKEEKNKEKWSEKKEVELEEEE